MERYDVKTRREARALNDRVSAAIAGKDEFAVFAPIVVETCRGCGADVWMCYDDAIGNAHSWIGAESYKVRQVRNHPTFGRMLCDAVNGRKVRA